MTYEILLITCLSLKPCRLQVFLLGLVSWGKVVRIPIKHHQQEYASIYPWCWIWANAVMLATLAKLHWFEAQISDFKISCSSKFLFQYHCTVTHLLSKSTAVTCARCFWEYWTIRRLFSWSFQLYIRAFQATPTPHTSRLNSWSYSLLHRGCRWQQLYHGGRQQLHMGVGLHRDAALGGLTLGYQFGILFETKVFIEHSWFIWKGNRAVPAMTILGEGASFGMFSLRMGWM